jgi:L-ascorbate metabolism protein UlaG (beta-lactamase superfamily)
MAMEIHITPILNPRAPGAMQNRSRRAIGSRFCVEIKCEMKITYWSHSCFFIETTSHRLVIDPFLTGNDLAHVSASEVECDFVLVTHGHFDHVGDAVAIAKRTGATIISSYEVADYLAQEDVKTHGMGVGGAHKFPFGQIKLTIAHHGGGYAPGGELRDGKFIYLGNPAGMLITADEKTIYHAGDTGLFLDMKLIGELDAIDLALLPIGDNFTMGSEDAARAAEFLGAKLSVPMHYNTFDLIKTDPDLFVKKVSARGQKALALKIGASLDI